MTIHDVQQRSPEWAALRLGRLCASRAADMLAVGAKGELAGRRNLRVQLVLERITGRNQERDFVSAAMKDGIEREPDAVALYELLTGVLVQPVGFVTHDTLAMGYSPDGFVGEDGLVEIKSPIPATHLSYLRSSGGVPAEYYSQIVHGLLLTGRQWCDFVSYQPDWPEPLRMKVVRVHCVDAVIAEYEKKATEFLKEVDLEVLAVQTLVASADQWRKSAEAVA